MDEFTKYQILDRLSAEYKNKQLKTMITIEKKDPVMQYNAIKEKKINGNRTSNETDRWQGIQEKEREKKKEVRKKEEKKERDRGTVGKIVRFAV